MIYQIYWDSHRCKFSIKKDGVLFAKGNTIVAYPFSFNVSKVSKAGRQRVLETKQKNVHAWLLAEELMDVTQENCFLDYLHFYKNNGFEIVAIYYNPYKVNNFKLLIPEFDKERLLLDNVEEHPQGIYDLNSWRQIVKNNLQLSYILCGATTDKEAIRSGSQFPNTWAIFNCKY